MTKQDRRAINPSRAMYDAYHFSQATRVGDMIWVSGQVGLDAAGKPGKDMAEQAHLAFTALRRVLEAAGAEMADIVELVTFHTDLRGEMEDFAKAKDAFIAEPYPSWTAVGVTQLAHPAFRIEIRAVAVAGSGAR